MIKHPKCDLHIHSIASGHAFNTIDEITKFSLCNGYRMVGISDHGPSMESAPHVGYFECLYRLPKEYNGMRILYGCEANILSQLGEIDLPDYVLPHLDFVMCGIHKRTSYSESDCDTNTRAIISAIESDKIDIISHPVSLGYAINPIEVINAAKKHGIIIEVNKSVMKEAVIHKRKNVIELTSQLIRYACKKGVNLLFGSDAHHISEMGISNDEMEMFRKIYLFSLEEAINTNPDELYTVLCKRKAKRELLYGI